MIQFVNVSKKYTDDIVAVDGINFEVNPGEFLFLIGPSGSGKTTLIRLLIKEEDPSDGKIYFDEEDITNYSRNKVYHLRRKIGVVFQDYKLLDDKTSYENISFVMEAAGKHEKEIKETVPYLLDIVGLADRMDAFPRELSGGEKQRIAIARALANNPKLLIADEPTGNLDPDAAWDIVQILKKINGWGTTVIMSTHGSDIVDKIGQRVLELNSGQIIRDDSLGGYKLQSQKEKNDFEQKIILSTTDSGIVVPETEIKEKKSDKKKDKKEESKEEKIKEEDKDDEKKDDETKIENKKEEILVEDVKPLEEVPMEVTQVESTTVVIKDESDKSAKNEVEPEKKEEESTEQLETTEEIKVEEPKVEKKSKPKLKISLVQKSKTDKNTKKNEPETKSHSEQAKSEIIKLKLAPKVYKLLVDNGYTTIRQVITAGVEELSKIKDITKSELDDIKNALFKYLKG